jgi:hypothetical protein
MTGSFLGPVDFGSSGSGTLYPDYVPSYGTIYGLPSSIAFGGSLEQRPLLEVSATFDLLGAGATYIQSNYLEFVMNMYTGNIYDSMLDVIYEVTPMNEVDIYLRQGTGTVSGSSFSINFPASAGNLDYTVSGVPTMVSASGSLTGTFNNANPDVGTQIVPSSSSVSLTYGGPTPAWVPSSLDIESGTVSKAGS